MDAEQTLHVCRAAPDSIVIAVHMEALDHPVGSRTGRGSTVTRHALRETAEIAGITDTQLRIPADGDTLEF